MANNNTENRNINLYIDVKGDKASPKELRKDFNALRKEVDGLAPGTEAWIQKTKKLNEVRDRVNELKKDTHGLRTGWIDMRQIMVGAWVAGVALAIQGIGMAIKATFIEIMKFTKALSELKSITGAGAIDLIHYSKAARDFGKTTTLSASQALQAFKTVGSAKPELLENRDALIAVTKEAVALAEASGEELPAATKALTDILNQFDLKANQSSRVINVLAAGSKFGAGEISYLNDAVTRFGPAAASMNMEIEESVAVMEVFAEKGLQSEKAGTQFRNILIKLAGDSSNYENGVFNLQKALKNLAPIQNDVTELTAMFGAENVLGAQILVKSADRVAYFTEAIKGTSTAYEQQAINIDNLDGDMKRLNSVIEAMWINLGDRLEPVLRGIVQLFGDWIEVIGDWIGIPVSEKLEEERIQLNILVDQITDANTSQERRNKLITQLQQDYPDFLKNIDIEKATTEQLRDRLKEVNAEYINKVLIQRKQEEIEEQLTKAADAREKQFEREEKLRRKILEVEKLTGKQIRDNKKSLQEQTEDAINAMISTSDGGFSLIRGGLLKDLEVLRGAMVAWEQEYNQELSIGNEMVAERDRLLKELGVTLEDVQGGGGTDVNVGGDIEEDAQPKGDPKMMEKKYSELIPGDNSETLLAKWKAFQNSVNQMVAEATEDNIKSMREREKAFFAERKKISEEVALLLMTDYERELFQTEEKYDKLIQKAQKHMLDVTAIEKKKQQEIARIQNEEQQKQLMAIGTFYGQMANLMGSTVEIFGTQGGMFAELQKGMTLFQIAMDTAAAISSLTAASEANPANALTFGGAGMAQFATGLARIFANIAQAKKLLTAKPPDAAKNVPKSIPGFFKGGFTGSGIGMFDADGRQIAGVVHPNEYVVNSEAMKNPMVADFTRIVEGMKGGNTGGSGSSRSAAPSIINTERMENLMVLMAGKMEAVGQKLDSYEREKRVKLVMTDLQEKESKMKTIQSENSY